MRKRSVAAFIDELERCEILGVSNLVAHPGSHVGAGEDEGIKTIAHSLDEVHKACPGYNVKVTLEITAGQGSNLGYRFEQIARMFDATKESDRLRVCFDTEHAFAAGYDIRSKEGYERTFAEFDEMIGLETASRLSPERLKEGIQFSRGPSRAHRQRPHRRRSLPVSGKRQTLLGPTHVPRNA